MEPCQVGLEPSSDMIDAHFRWLHESELGVVKKGLGCKQQNTSDQLQEMGRIAPIHSAKTEKCILCVHVS